MAAFIFDVDDTVYDQLRPFELALSKHFKIDEEDIEELYVLSRKYSDQVFHLSVSGELSMREMHVYRIQKALADFGIEISKEQASQFQLDYEKYQGEITLLDGIREVFDYCLAEEISLGVITNGPTEHQWGKIKQLGIEKWVPKEHIIVSGEVGLMKPQTEIFELAEKRMNLTKADSYYIGDSFNNDVIGAKNAGWRAIWYNKRHHKPAEAAVSCDYYVNEASLLLPLVQKL